MEDEKKASVVGVRLDSELKERAQCAANADHRTLASWVRKIIQQAVERYEQSAAA